MSFTHWSYKFLWKGLCRFPDCPGGLNPNSIIPIVCIYNDPESGDRVDLSLYKVKSSWGLIWMDKKYNMVSQMAWKCKPIAGVFANEANSNNAFDSDVKILVLTVYEYALRTMA